MKRCELSDITKNNYIVKDISAILQTPTYRTLKMESRQCNGFLVIENGSCKYSWENQSVEMQKGSLIYLPYNSKHSLQILSEDFSFYRINFTVLDGNQEKMTFSNTPMLLFSEIDLSTFEIIRKMTDLFLNSTRSFKLRSFLFELFDAIETNALLNNLSPVEKLITHINNNYTNKISSNELQKICHISPAQMYRKFKKETGLTPMAYQNKLRISKAKTLLKSDICSVGYISEILGFESIYYFSRIFKKATGVSPAEYRKKNQTSIFI